MPTPAAASPLFPPEARADIQGFVTSGFAHLPVAGYLFMAFETGADARAWLRELVPSVTTAASWRPRPDAPKAKPAQTVNVAFTAPGLEALGAPASCLETFPVEFRQGMAHPDRSRALGDVGIDAPEHWQLGGSKGPTIHALVHVGAADPAALDRELERLRERAAAHRVAVAAEETGARLPGDKEPFGFRDGIAQPRILGIQSTGVRAGEFILGYPNEYGCVPPSPVVEASADPGHLLPDSENPYHPGLRDLGRHGTFLVYRKLEQDVAGFWRWVAAEARRLQGTSDPAATLRLAAKLMGRWPGGAPLSLAPEGDEPALRNADDFLYAETDPRGRGCPFGAHIRRMNPRDQLNAAAPRESLHMTARHRILRRGRPYGPPLFDLSVLDGAADPAAGSALGSLRDDGQARGLHFLCVNASLKSQFEFIQQAWANNPQFNGLTNNPDPIIGVRADGGPPASMGIPCPGLDQRTGSMPRFVTVRGGGYFFLPGRRALAFLAAA